MKTYFGTIVPLLVLCTLFVHAQEHIKSLPEIDAILQQHLKKNAPGCVIGIIQNGEFIHKKAYGLANLELETPLNTSSVFRIASTSKQFTAACIFLLEQQHKLSLEDDIRKYLPDFPSYNDTIRVKHLIYHTSGLRDYTGLMYLMGREDDYQYTPADLYALIVRQRELDFSPGSRFSYCNTGYFLLARIVEVVSQLTLNTYAQKNLFNPLGMTNTHYHDNHRSVVKNRAYGYSFNGSVYETSMSNNDICGDGGIFTTLEDLQKWDENFYSHRIGGNTFYKKMTTVGTLNNGASTPYAGGLFIRNYRGLQKINHTGWYAGYKSSIAQYPEVKVTIIILANAPQLRPPVLNNKIANVLLKDQLKPVNPPKKRPKKNTPKIPHDQNVPDTLLSNLTGTFYSSELDFTYEIILNKNHIYSKLENNRLAKLFVNQDNQLMVDEYIALHPQWDEKHEQIQAFTLSVGDSQNILFTRVK